MSRLGFKLRFGIGVVGEQHRGVAFDVEYLHGAIGVFRKFEGVVGQSGHRRGGLHADLDKTLDAQSAGSLLGKQQVLGFDPTHRTGELPGQQFDDDPAADLIRALGDPGVVVGEDLVE